MNNETRFVLAYELGSIFYNRSQMIARHVMNIHMNRGGDESGDVGELSLEKMKRYIAYCKG